MSHVLPPFMSERYANHLGPVFTMASLVTKSSQLVLPLLLRKH